ncbi:unnamed protein product [Alopecurus aequalis]
MEPDVLVRILDGKEKPTNLPLALLENITAHFSKEREIGHGGFATVYKGILANGNVAVKRIRSNHTIDEKIFYREVNSLMGTNHPNIVRFVGFCASTEQIAIKKEGSREYIYAEIRERLLCFEYISNGSLQKYITDELRGLDWSTRYRLIKGICDGLHYLHIEKHIYHMDLKPGNVLLDNDMVPKITDFGLARLDEKSQTMSADRCGSLGYCAPEYLQSGKMSFKSDMYSLGTIIIELVTGKRSIPDNNKNNVLRRWRHRWKKTGEESPLCYQQVTKCIEIGLLCQEIDPCKRPFISEIIRDISQMDCTAGQISVEAIESTFGPINPYMEDDMLGIEPLELHFPFELNRQISCSLQLTNETNSYIAFNIQKTRPLPYCLQPHTDIVPPRSKSSVHITLQPQDKAPRDMQHTDEFIVRSTRVNDGIAVEDINTEMLNQETNREVDEVNLDVVFDAQLQSEFFDVLNSAQQEECAIQKGPHENLQSSLDMAEQLFSSNSNDSNSNQVLSHVGVLFKALVKMEGEFPNQLSQHSKSMEPDRLFDCLLSMLRPSSESRSEDGKHPSAGAQSDNQEAVIYSLPALIEPKFVPLLAKLAQQFVQAGCQQQCAEIYSEARASALESSLKNLGVEETSKDEVQKMSWEIFESKTGNWIHFMRISVKFLFAGERQLCDQVFECRQSLRDKCFSAITQNNLATLISFGEAISMSERSPEKLFVLLDMYKIMCELQTEIDTIFVGESCSQMRDSALSLTKCLAQTAQKIISDFEEAVEKDGTKAIVADGTVHPLTSYVINYVKFLFDYQSTLKQLFEEFKREDGTGSELASVTISIMQALQNNLDDKAKVYKDPALMHIFLMNNINYIVRSVRRSDAKDLLGDDWIRRHRLIVEQNANQYRRVAWSKVLQYLSGQDFTSSVGSGVSRAAVKERFRSFNVLFQEIYEKQCGWSVPDSELRESLRLAVAEILLAAYRSFRRRFGPLIDSGKASEKYIKHTPEQLELLLYDLFEGKQERT